MKKKLKKKIFLEIFWKKSTLNRGIALFSAVTNRTKSKTALIEIALTRESLYYLSRYFMQKLSIYFSLLLGNFEEEYPMQIVYCKADQNSMLVR